jgi:nitrate/nitrite transporter NarK
VYGLDIRMVAVIAIAFSLPAGLLRVAGGVLSDRYGARRVMYWSFIGSLGFFMALGKAAVPKPPTSARPPRFWRSGSVRIAGRWKHYSLNLPVGFSRPTC